MKYFLIAGEASGDLHAAGLIESIRRRDPEAKFQFLGGDLMAEAAGCQPIIHYRHMAYMGFSAVIRHLRKILGNLSAAKKAIAAYRPDAVILIDLPSFNLKVAKYAHSISIPVYYYISPKIWAWKEHRVKAIKKYVRRVLAIFPFEVDFYRKHGYEVDFVGNPSVSEVDSKLSRLTPRPDFLARHTLRDRPIIALLPGSRRGEIGSNLPIMAAAADRFPQYRPVVAGAPGIEPGFYSGLTKFPVVTGETFELLAHSRGAIVTSGTATLEAALIGTPQVACYRSNGSRLAYKIMERILKVEFVTLPNLIATRKIIPEMLLHMCTPDTVSEELARILRDGEGRQAQIDGYADMRQRLGTESAPENAAKIIVGDLTSH